MLNANTILNVQRVESLLHLVWDDMPMIAAGEQDPEGVAEVQNALKAVNILHAYCAGRIARAARDRAHGCCDEKEA